MLSARMRLVWLVLLGFFAACRSAAPQAAPRASVAPTTPSTDRALMLRQLADAERALAQNPRGEEELIWVGRRLAYLGRIDDAQAVYTRGLELYPESWKLLRHRGHRWITLRQFDRAVEDLSQAWQYSRGLRDEIEPDGQPNAAGIPLSSYHSNIIYHLALAYYLRGEWSAACEVWDQGREASTQNDDRRCSATYWNVLASRRGNRAADSSELLAPIHRSMVILENQSYLELCLLLKGESTPESVLLGIESGSTEFATRAYGVACWCTATLRGASGAVGVGARRIGHARL
jgi:tetratricopeptide (TPR) repeat protein